MSDLNLEALIAFFSMQPSVAAAILFGSAATGRMRPDSDLDLAVLFDEGHVPDPFEVFDLRETVEKIAQRDVDLVVLNNASPILAFQAAKYGTLLVCNHQRAYHLFLARLISEYADFKRVRRPIEEAVLQRRIYG